MTIGSHQLVAIGREVKGYDSKYSGDDLDISLMHQLALVYRALITVEEDGEVDLHLVHIPPVQQQKWSSDCGVYAITRGGSRNL